MVDQLLRKCFVLISVYCLHDFRQNRSADRVYSEIWHVSEIKYKSNGTDTIHFVLVPFKYTLSARKTALP